MSQYLYFITSLPGLPPIGEKPPLSLYEFKNLVSDMPVARQVTDIMLLERDLLERQSAVTGRSDLPDPLVLARDQMEDKAPLPEWLQPEGKSGRDDDSIWGGYFKRMWEMGKELPCPFLSAWAGFEVALRNTISVERIKRLRQAPEDYLVAESIEEMTELVESALSRWSGAKNPYDAARELDMVRWEMLQEIGAWFSFSIDEIAAYTRGLMLLHRWAAIESAASDENHELLTRTAISSPDQ